MRDSIRAVQWQGERLRLIDQRLLPGRHDYRDIDTVAACAQAIRDLVVRGAPAIGVAAAYGVVLAARARYAQSADGWQELIQPDLVQLAGARVTAVNLRWAVERMRRLIQRGLPGDPVPQLLAEARSIHEEDIASNYRMGSLGAELIEPGSSVLTHCNAGSLATGGFGTALGVVRAASSQGRISRVFADETRPWLQGTRLTAWELLQDGIPVTLLADGAAAWLMKRNALSWVIVGADRIAANGDCANKIGTYSLALAARRHGVGFMVVAPTSTIDLSTPDGSAIPIEERAEAELAEMHGARIAPEGARVWNPVFDVTDAELVDVLVTERGVVRRPGEEGIRALLR